MTAAMLILFMWVLPIVIAMCRKHRNTAPIIVVNLLLGWTVLGWLVALIWAFTDNVKSRETN